MLDLSKKLHFPLKEKKYSIISVKLNIEVLTKNFFLVIPNVLPFLEFIYID